MSQTQNQVVSLGCGTLIAIAIIVAVFAGTPNKSAINDLQQEVRDLKDQVRKQTEAIEALRKEIGQLSPQAPSPKPQTP